MSTTTIIGAGSFGTALALVAAQAGHTVQLVARDASVVDAINTQHQNSRYLPNVTLSSTITATGDMDAVTQADRVLLAVPAQATRTLLLQVKPYLKAPLLLCAKGLERDTGKRLDEVAQEVLQGHGIALLSGPGFHHEIAAGKPVAVTIAGADTDAWCTALATGTFRPYAQDDIVGVALAGALKNPLAIGAGIIAGADLGESARAAFITRGLAEITRLGLACGAKAQTFMGLSGIGDVFLTCSSPHSRNYRYGMALARGEALPTFTVEGLPTIAAAVTLGARHTVDLPIMNALRALCYDKQDIRLVLQSLLSRPLRSEA